MTPTIGVGEPEVNLPPAQRKFITFAPRPDCGEPVGGRKIYGEYIIYVDRWLGITDSAFVAKTCGVSAFDLCALRTLEKWRFAKDTIRKCRVRLEFERH